METPFEHQPYRLILNKWDSKDLFAAASAIRALRDTRGWETVLDLMGQVREGHEAQLIFGQATDDATVSRLRGVVAGLKGAEVAADAVLLAAEQVQAKLENEQSGQTAGAER